VPPPPDSRVPPHPAAAAVTSSHRPPFPAHSLAPAPFVAMPPPPIVSVDLDDFPELTQDEGGAPANAQMVHTAPHAQSHPQHPPHVPFSSAHVHTFAVENSWMVQFPDPSQGMTSSPSYMPALPEVPLRRSPAHPQPPLSGVPVRAIGVPPPPPPTRTAVLAPAWVQQPQQAQHVVSASQLVKPPLPAPLPPPPPPQVRAPVSRAIHLPKWRPPHLLTLPTHLMLGAPTSSPDTALTRAAGHSPAASSRFVSSI
jgi:hypothetical protein